MMPYEQIAKIGICFVLDGVEHWRIKPDPGERTLRWIVKPAVGPMTITRGHAKNTKKPTL